MKPINIYRPTLQFVSDSWRYLSLLSHNFTVKLKKALTNPPYTSAQQHTADRLSDSLVNKVEHLAAKETDISLRSWWRPKQS